MSSSVKDSEMEGVKNELGNLRKMIEVEKGNRIEMQGAMQQLARLGDGVEKMESKLDSVLKVPTQSLKELDSQLSSFKTQIVNQQVNVKKELCLLQKRMEKMDAQLKEAKQILDRLEKRILKLEMDSKDEKERILRLENKFDEAEAAATLRAERFETKLENFNRNASLVGSPSTNLMPNEFQLREKKRNNLVIFGLLENKNQPDSQQDKSRIQSLLHDLAIDCNSLQDNHLFRVGRYASEKCRPIILKLQNAEVKQEILAKAKNLKGNDEWKGVGITHDLTKLQCAEVKARELQLRNDAYMKNKQLSDEDMLTKIWKVVGGRGARHVALKSV